MSNILLSFLTMLNFQNQPMYLMSEYDNIYINQEKTLRITTIDCKEKIYLDLVYVTYNEEWNGTKQMIFSNGVSCQISKIESNLLNEG